MQLKGLAATEAQQEDRERVQAWRASVSAEWGTKPGVVYCCLKEEGSSTLVVFIVRLDGTSRANVREMDELARAACGPINRKYLRRPFTHVDFVAKRHDSWRFQHPFFAPQKSISFFRPTPRGFSSWDTTTSPFVASRGVRIHPLFRAQNCII